MSNNNKPSRALLHPTHCAFAVQLALAALSGVAYADEVPDDLPLQQVQVVGVAERGYGARSSATATKTDTLLRDTPQAITVVSQELIRDQGMQNMADVIRYVPGIVTTQGEGNRDAVVMRGNSSTGDFFIDGVRDDVQYYRDLYNIDRVEALKGPNAMIFGRGGSGGVINRVSKEPLWTPVRSASVTLGSWNERRLTADVGQALSESAAWRVNAMSGQADSYRDGVHSKRHGINPSFALRPDANTSIVLDFEHFRDERTADRGVPSYNGRPYDSAPSTFFGSADLSNTWARVNAFNALIEHDFGNGLLLRNRSRFASYDKFYQNVFASQAVRLEQGVPSLPLGAYNNATGRKNQFNQTDLNYTVDAFGLRHKLAAGFEFGRQVTDNYRQTGYFSGSAMVPASAPYPAGPITFRQSDTDADNHGIATTGAAYIQDQLEFSPQWQAVVGLRHDRFHVDFTNRRNGERIEVTDTPLSPRVGLVYKPVQALSIYASYSRAFAPRAGDQLASLTAKTSSFDPEKFTNIELGAKWDLQPDLSATAAIYRLDRTNVLVTDPLDATRSILVDGQRSRGLELGLQGKLTRAWSVMAGYAWQDARLTAAQSATVPAGTIVPQVPRHTLSAWNRYDFNRSFGAALGLVYRDYIYASTTNTVSLPSYARVDAALFYTLGKDYRLQLNVENLFDKRYWASANSDNNITPGSPRALRLTLNASF